MELIYTMMAEETTRLLAIKEDAQGYKENRAVAAKAAHSANESRKRFEKTTGLKVVTSGLRKKLAAVNILQFLSFVEPFELPF